MQTPLKDIVGSRGNELGEKKIALCVTGSVAAIHSPIIARELMRHGADVHVVMTSAAQRLVRAELFEWATGNSVVTELTGKTEHIQLAGEWVGKVDLVLVAPCTANTVSKFVNGVDDTPVTTVLSCALGTGIPIIIAPAMHEPMAKNPFVAANLDRLKKQRVEVVEPRIEEGKAKIAGVEQVVDAVIKRLGKKDFRGMNILVTGGPTMEPIDPVRVISNRSSGRMGLALAEEAGRRGAQVNLITGPSKVDPPDWLRVVKIESTEEMAKAVEKSLKNSKINVAILAAAPADYAPEEKSKEKISSRSKPRLSLTLKATPKIVNSIKKLSPKTFLVAFKAEPKISTKELIRRAETLMRESQADMVAANMTGDGTAFGGEDNEVYLLSRGSKVAHIPRTSKQNVAAKILDVVKEELKGRT
ncbi:MAG: bifunctional phosphopantothenoylcysteine decarboxylase/phosphopantothenate--cysteine ligase CoaBC [Thaumarchaeota archaeon]|nr:bifunctional phosphopantothenoylcysteine decarboxylase/phosphopantothenate--cysteine ligase CoaBC [Nitrososphaerota archaeon]